MHKEEIRAMYEKAKLNQIFARLEAVKLLVEKYPTDHYWKDEDAPLVCDMYVKSIYVDLGDLRDTAIVVDENKMMNVFDEKTPIELILALV